MRFCSRELSTGEFTLLRKQAHKKNQHRHCWPHSHWRRRVMQKGPNVSLCRPRLFALKKWLLQRIKKFAPRLSKLEISCNLRHLKIRTIMPLLSLFLTCNLSRSISPTCFHKFSKRLDHWRKFNWWLKSQLKSLPKAKVLDLIKGRHSGTRVQLHLLMRVHPKPKVNNPYVYWYPTLKKWQESPLITDGHRRWRLQTHPVRIMLLL